MTFVDLSVICLSLENVFPTWFFSLIKCRFPSQGFCTLLQSQSDKWQKGHTAAISSIRNGLNLVSSSLKLKLIDRKAINGKENCQSNHVAFVEIDQTHFSGNYALEMI